MFIISSLFLIKKLLKFLFQFQYFCALLVELITRKYIRQQCSETKVRILTTSGSQLEDIKHTKNINMFIFSCYMTTVYSLWDLINLNCINSFYFGGFRVTNFNARGWSRRTKHVTYVFFFYICHPGVFLLTHIISFISHAHHVLYNAN